MVTLGFDHLLLHEADYHVDNGVKELLHFLPATKSEAVKH
jgi:hypothetical protein